MNNEKDVQDLTIRNVHIHDGELIKIFNGKTLVLIVRVDQLNVELGMVAKAAGYDWRWITMDKLMALVQVKP